MGQKWGFIRHLILLGIGEKSRKKFDSHLYFVYLMRKRVVTTWNNTRLRDILER